MRILHIYKDYPPVYGGIEHHVRDLCEGLAARGHTVTALVTSTNQRTSVEQVRPGLLVVRAGRVATVASTPLSPAMLGLARAAQPDIVHLHFPYPPGDCAALAVPGTPPLVVTYHSDIVRQQTLLRLYRPLLEHTLGRAACIIATSPASIDSSPFLSRYAAKCTVVPLGVDVGRFAPLRQEEEKRRRGEEEKAHSSPLLLFSRSPLLLFVGRLRYYKGLHILLEAMPHVDATLLLAGDGPERVRLEAQVRALGLGSKVRFLGDVPEQEKPALYRTADVFVLPAHLRAEAFGIALAEALASGLPCVSTELGTGTSYANLHGVTGLVVPPGDATALAGALNTLLADPHMRQRYGEAARRRAFGLLSLEAMVGGVEAVYRTLNR
jgi:glycosyltransferase involved in cell wall biosynthesis